MSVPQVWLRRASLLEVAFRPGFQPRRDDDRLDGFDPHVRRGLEEGEQPAQELHREPEIGGEDGQVVGEGV